ncbi:hypothetical protein [Thermus brockianus]|uniref:Uncharacterized protein n=1 Tax=Thermus brockianus TaxID=56956 RepID=A0ABM7XKW3_THEBO|nr:hypothetical protein [Thermus brockianus]BDG16971.1 hypothetical protein TbrSNM41_17050 [Thermus brockianus]
MRYRYRYGDYEGVARGDSPREAALRVARMHGALRGPMRARVASIERVLPEDGGWPWYVVHLQALRRVRGREVVEREVRVWVRKG